MIKNKKINNKIQFIPYIWLGLIVVGLMAYMYFYFMNTCNDDASAEMILSNLLARKGGILSRDWQYSTELRVFNTQIVFSFLFHFINSWKWVRVIGNGLLYIAIIASTYYLCKVLDIKKYFPIVAATMILPSSREYFEFAVHGTYLIPHLIISILTVALFIDIQNCKGKGLSIRLALLGLIAFVAGLGGIRHILILYIPLFLVSIVYWIINNKKSIYNIIYSLGILIISLIGYVINSKVLCVRYHLSGGKIGTYGEDLIFVDFHFSNLEEVINGWLKCYGFQVGKRMVSTGTICNVLAALLIIVSLYVIKTFKSQNKQTKILILFWGATSLILSALFIFTNMAFFPRYLFQAHIFLFPTLACVFKESKISINDKRLLAVLFALYISFVASCNLHEFIGENYTVGMREATDILIDKGYTKGYSTSYWYWGNGMIEYSNGKIITYRLDTDDKETYYRMGWLEQISLENDIPESKVFIATTKDKEATNSIEIIYEDDEKIVYGYPSYEQLIKDFNIKTRQ